MVLLVTIMFISVFPGHIIAKDMDPVPSADPRGKLFSFIDSLL